MMRSAIDNPTSCEILAVIHFLHTKTMSALEIHHELCVPVYGQNVTCEETVRQWCRMFKDGRMDKRMFTMKSEVVGHMSHLLDDLVQSVDQKICQRRHFTFSELSYEFPQISHPVLYNIITVRLG
jgi:hypothetical protein